VSETEPDSGWSEQYAETGGWPPPAAGQRRYGPGTTTSPAAADPGQAGQPTNPDTGGPPDQTDTGGYGQPYRPAAPSGPATGYGQPDPADPGGAGQSGQWGYPGPADTGGYAQPSGYGQPDPAGPGGPGQSGQWGHAGPADTGGYAQPSGYGQPGQWEPAGQSGPTGENSQPGQPGPAGYGQPGPADTGGYGQPTGYGQADPSGQWAQGGTGAVPWAPGDPAYGRLEPGAPARPQRPRRPWDGRPAPARRPTGTPVVTYTLIGICVVVYLLQQANPSFTTRYGLIPYAVEQGQYARLITSAFLHAGLLHLVTNMITLFIVGTPLERVLRPARFLLVYVLSALGGSLLSVWLSPQFSVGVGASGAIFGLFGALVVLRRQVGAEAGGLAVLIGLNLVISFTVPNISWQAHIGGLVTGVLVALALRGVDRLSRRPAT
jgi:membrane associated rhomboid family serine protease